MDTGALGILYCCEFEKLRIYVHALDSTNLNLTNHCKYPVAVVVV